MRTTSYKLDVPATPSLSDQIASVAVSASAVEAGEQLNRMKLSKSCGEYEKEKPFRIRHEIFSERSEA